ncbi:MAG: hypothetical protein IPG60_10555 [Bacteroidetes bacterium]|nr:hypothetical protein [Bacteroidota bacterium]
MHLYFKNYSIISVMYSLLLLSVLSCGSVLYNENIIATTTREDMMNALRNADTIAIVYSGEDKHIEPIIQLLQQQAASSDRNIFLLITPAANADLKSLSAYPLYLIGTTQHLTTLKNLQHSIPFQIVLHGFEFDHKVYTDNNDLLKISLYPNPQNNKMPATIITGNDDEVLAEYIRNGLKDNYGYFFWDSWGYQIYRNNKRIVLGYFSDNKTTPWKIDKKLHWEFDYTGKEIGSNAYCKFIDHNSIITSTQLDSITTYIERNMQAIENFAGKKITTTFNYHLYPSTEIKGLMLNNTDQSNVDFNTRDVHAVYEKEFNENYSGSEMLLATRDLFGKAQVQCLETGVATMFNSKWCEHGYKFWTMKLYRSGNMPALNQILSNESFNTQSPYLMDCTAALFIEFVVENEGKENFISNFNSYSSDALLQLEKSWKKFLEKQSENFPSTQETIGYNSTEKIKGFNFAHEGYQIFNGYLGSSADQSLVELQSLGTNAISIIPYGFLQEMNTPAPFRYARGAGSENDESVIKCAYVANQLGMSAMLKPQLWTWKGWTGDLEMSNEEDWQQFFTYYYDWIIHYAFIAELYHFDFFCIGVEFKTATLSHEQEWRDLFTQVRALYSGKITYAANWGDEFENVTFWDQLDYISVNSYYPLSDKKEVSDAELKLNFELILDKLEVVQKKYNKPLLITEIGFKSIDYPWIEPHADNDEQNYNEVSQRRCYEAMFEALQDEYWVSGLYIWQWPSYMDFVKEYPKGFTPCDKEAEAVIKKYYSKP